ncbi:MAG: glutathione peroxidase [Chromatiales bacterium]|jgi:glutathione peroxidase
MKTLQIVFILLLGGTAMSASANQCPDLLDFEMRKLASDEKVRLCDEYRDKVILVVNTASKCGFTGQYEGLEKLYSDYKDKGLVVLGFPSNDFGGQEPGSEEKIQSFCRLTYSVQFPMFEKTHASKAKADTIYKKLGEAAGEYPRWNFHKYLIDRNGELVASYSSFTKPQSGRLIRAIEGLL